MRRSNMFTGANPPPVRREVGYAGQPPCVLRLRGAHPVAAANAVLLTGCERLTGSARGPASF